jgi:hypothetical protein
MIVTTNKNTFNNVISHSDERIVYKDSSGVTWIHELSKYEHIKSAKI